MGFTVIPAAPTIASFNPPSGYVGDAIAINGTNLTGATSVKFNSVESSFTVNSATQITATIPPGCSSGLVEVTTAGGTVRSSNGFTVNTAGDGGGAIAILDEGDPVIASATSINFVGAGVTASGESGLVTVNIPSGGENGSAFDPVVKTTDYMAVGGDIIIADTSNGSWELTLPPSPALGDPPITVYSGSDFSVYSLQIKLGATSNKYQSQTVDSSKLVANKAWSSFQLFYAGPSVGWLDFPGNTVSPQLDPFPGSALWLRGSLTDLSGNERNAIPVGQNSPTIVTGLDDKPALRFTDLGAQELQVAYFLAETTAATLYIVFTPSSDVQYNLIKTSGIDDYWRFSGDGSGYFGCFQSSRNNNYPSSMPNSGNHLVSIHAGVSSYEVLLDNTAQGVLNKPYSSGDRFRIAADSTSGKQYNGDISEILVYPSFLGKNSSAHAKNINYFKLRYPSLVLAK